MLGDQQVTGARDRQELSDTLDDAEQEVLEDVVHDACRSGDVRALELSKQRLACGGVATRSMGSTRRKIGANDTQNAERVRVLRIHFTARSTEGRALTSTTEVDFFGLRRLRGAVGRGRDRARDRLRRVPRAHEPRADPAARASRGGAVVARPDSSARVRRAHDVANARGARRVLGVLVELRDVGGEERARRQAARADPRRAPVGADPGLHLDHRRILFHARARPCDRRRDGRDLRDLHEPGLEHGVQRLSVLRTVPSNSAKPRIRFISRRGCGSGSSRCRSRCPRSSGT